MHESFPTPDIVPSKRSEEEKRLRGVIELLEKSAQQRPWQDYEKPVLAAEIELRNAEDERMAKESNEDERTEKRSEEEKRLRGVIELLEKSAQQRPWQDYEKPVLAAEIELRNAEDERMAKESNEDERTEKRSEDINVAPAQKRMLEAEAAYLNANRKHLSNPIISKLAEGTRHSPEYNERKHLESLREEYNRARSEFAAVVNSSVEKRLNEKNRGIAQIGTTKDGKIVGSTKDLYSDNPDRKKIVRERFGRIVLPSDAMLRAEQGRAEEMFNGLDEHSQKLFKKTLNLFEEDVPASKKNASGKIARSVRVIAAATALLVGVGGIPADSVRLLTGASAMHQHTTTVRINKKGEGADALWSNLKQQLRKSYADPNKAPPKVQHILNSSPHNLSEEYGFASGHDGALPEQSAPMYIGDTLQYNPSNGSLIFDGRVLKGDANNRTKEVEALNQFDSNYTISKATGNANTSESQSSSAVPSVFLSKKPHSQESDVSTEKAETPQQYASDDMPFLKYTTQVTKIFSKEKTLHDDEGNVIGNVIVNSSEDTTCNGSYSESEHPATNTSSKRDALNDNEGNVVVDYSRNMSCAGSYVGSEHHIIKTTVHEAHDKKVLNNEIKKLLNSSELGKYADAPMSDVLYQSQDVSITLHKKLVAIVSSYGVGPKNNETLGHFLEQVSGVVSSRKESMYKYGAHDAKISIDETHIYQNISGSIVVYGGDIAAQRLIAYEYLLEHPGGRVMVPYKMSSGHMTASYYSFTHATKNIPPLQLLKPILDSKGKPVPPIDVSTLTKPVQ